MKERLIQWQQKIDGLNQRERILLLLSGLVVVIMLMQTLLIDPLIAEQAAMKAALKNAEQNINQQNNARQIISAELQAGVNRSELRRKESLEQEYEQLSKQIESSLVTMIPPRLMPEVLENILENNSGLKLLAINNKPVVALFEKIDGSSISNDEKKPSAEHKGLYKHSFVLEFEGGYMAAIDYFQRLEKLPWRFQWDELHYQVEHYPTAIITLEVHTVSMSEEWIGV
jgi:MSHA biogenesis protein MshJ